VLGREYIFDELQRNNSVSVDVATDQMPHGGKGTKRAENNLRKKLANKQSIVRIQNKDDLCMA
jgi:hypothetical protein